jgi:tetratricopeptide (TPR) repeat protein
MNKRLIAVLAACLCACGSADPRTLNDEASKALSSGQYAEAAASYGKALDALASDTGNPEWKRAKLGKIQAEARIDGAKAKTEFLEYARANTGKVTDADYNLVASKLGDAGKFPEAIEVLEAGKQAFPESPHLQALLSDLGKRAEASGDSSALDKLKGLGYVGGD